MADSQRPYRRTEAAIQALRSGGREEGLLHLFTAWHGGATILAGLGVPQADPVRPGPRVVRACQVCGAWCIGADRLEANDRLAGHVRRCHG